MSKRPLRTGDLQNRAADLRVAVEKRAKGESWTLWIAARLLSQVGEVLSLAEEVARLEPDDYADIGAGAASPLKEEK